jgi:DNA-directed RNA polymerase specialized sigma24 family protein
LESDEGDSTEVDRPLAFWVTVINNLGRDRSRRTRRWNFDHGGTGDLLCALPAGSMSAEQQMFLKECLTATDRGLARLSDRQRTAVLLRSAGIDYSEIGETLSTSSANARKIVETARTALQSPPASGTPRKTARRRPGSAHERPVYSYLVES